MTAAPTMPAPSGKRLALATLGAAAVAAVVLVTCVLPAEYGIDPTGIGRALGLTQMAAPARTIEIADPLAGNEGVREVEIPEFGQPVPLPNPEIHQAQAAPARTETMRVELPPGGETEIKAVLGENKVITYSWQVDRGTIYSDFHGHDPAVGGSFFVRYQEHQEGSGGSGSLVAPFGGEHGWYWLNYNDFPVVVTLTVTGFQDRMVDYGVHVQP